MMLYDTSRRVVRSWPGPGTAETFYEDDRGNVWRTAPPGVAPSASGTASGDQRAWLSYGRIVFTEQKT